MSSSDGASAESHMTDSVTIVTGPVQCPGCKHEFAGLAFEDVMGVTQLRCGDVLINKIDSNCIHCGWRFYWTIRDRELKQIAATYGELRRRYLAE